MITVLMYHAIPDAGSVPPGADPHYSVTMAQFDAHLARMQALGLRPASVLDGLPPGAQGLVGVTFDDGHVTNLAAALRLHRAGGRADFFVNPGTVGTAGFLNWPQLREMAALGMSIQSHGFTHRLLDQLGPDQVRAELADSKHAIEDALGHEVTLYAPAGGRVVPGLGEQLQELGYRHLCSSRVGLWNPATLTDIPRLAVLAGTDLRQLTRWLTQAPLEMAWQVGRWQALGRAKRLLGNDSYVRLRNRLLGQPVAAST